MMYHQKMILAVKSKGKILREFKDVVKLPFGSEYSLLIKNLHNKRAQVSVEIDGQDVLNGRSIIINGNDETELTRFVNDLSTGNTFKFIERTEGIEQHRGIKLDDGIIRITFKYELPPQPINLAPSWIKDNIKIGQIQGGLSSYRQTKSGNSIDWMSGEQERGIQCCAQPNTNMYGSAAAMYTLSSDVGITVPGSISNQQFRETIGFVTEHEEHVMILRLSGVVEGQLIIEPITVKTKPTCITCGHLNKATNKFCNNCGTSLTIV